MDFKKLFGNFQDMDRMQENPNGFEAHWEWPKELGHGFMSMIKIRPGLVLGIGKYKLKEDLTISFENEHPLIDLGFSVSGDVKYRITHEKGQEDFYHYKSRHSIINCLPSCRGRGRSPSKKHIACVRIHTEPTVLKDLLTGCRDNIPDRLQDILNGDNENYYCRSSALTPLCNMAVQQILDCPYQGPLRRLYLESKTLELITHTMAQFLTPDVISANITGLRLDDLERIRKAEHLLNNSLENPPSLMDLAMQVGLNKNKLNQGFRQQFGTSVFDHLRILRLERARKLLKSKEKSVTEVAFNVGYKHHGNFTRAFKKHFGTNPQDLLS
ncbi:MAG: helix-turn-helix transcriptional regulator [Desulfobacteraceae bacterium]|nr:helix-turn-helix transcriptional regulator [Desulfobacteraceae bacterium]